VDVQYFHIVFSRWHGGLYFHAKFYYPFNQITSRIFLFIVNFVMQIKSKFSLSKIYSDSISSCSC
jgi:hypothetical protein